MIVLEKIGRQYKSMKTEDLINKSINDTLSRTILTVFTTLLANLVLILFGGHVIQQFCITIFVGIVIGTLSSIYISSPILIHLNTNANIGRKTD